MTYLIIEMYWGRSPEEEERVKVLQNFRVLVLG
jgi:hypothetical protein